MTISNNVSKLSEYEDAVFYRVNCSCMGEDCDLTLEMEYDKKCNCIDLNIYSDLKWSAYWGSPYCKWYSILWRKIKAVIRLLFIGHIEVSEGILIQDKEHIDAFIEALQEGSKKLERKEVKK